MAVLDDFKVPVKTVVVIVGWVASILGVYYTMKSRLDDVQKQSDKMEQRLERYNPEVIEYKVSNIELKMSKIDEKTDRIQQLLAR